MSTTPHACVIGLDGVPHSMLAGFLNAGVMPRLAEIARDGVLLPMFASLPEISAVSWSTFMTGRNPGEHGIYGFTDLHPGTYRTRFPGFQDLKTETIWDQLGRRGLRSVVINQPATYPARPIPGALVSGFVAVRLERSIVPLEYLPIAREMGYEIDLDADKLRGDPPGLFRQLGRLLGMRRAMMDALWERERWNLMEVVVTGTDRLHHLLWSAFENPTHPHHADFLDYYRSIDAFIGYVFDRFSRLGDGANFFVLSDHGFCGTRREVYLNAVLAEHGFSNLGPGTDSLEAISEQSKAFVLDPARVYLHRRGKYPRGSVADADAERLKREITDLITSLTDDGGPVVRHVFDANDVYSGPERAAGPDLLVVPQRGFDLKGRIGAPSPFGTPHLQGMHTWDDAFFFTRRRDLMGGAGDALQLAEVPGMILRSLDAAS